jgi:outer membrane protein assembly factor BamA
LIEERSWVRAHFEYRKTLTRRFFGRGPDRKSFQESSYTDEVFDVGLGASWSMSGVLNPLVAELELGGEFHQLDDGTVQGVLSTRLAYPIDFARAQTSNLGLIGAALRWDTRDSQRNPYRGYVVGVRMDAAPLQTDWDAGAVFKLFATKVFAVPGLFHRGGDPGEAHPPTDTLVFAMFSQATVGELPFFLLPTLGGGRTLRGYIDGRWRDRASWFAGAEYRFWVIPRGVPLTRNIRIERLGLAAFYEIGATTPDVGSFFDSKAAMSYGFGLRVSLERAALFRLDFGFSPDGFNFTAGFGLSF